MKTLVTGGAGFIGSWLSESLIAAGHEVFVLDDLSTGFLENVPKRATFHLGDLAATETADWIEAQRFEVVYHQAAQLDVRKSVADPVFDAQVNIVGSLRLLEACQKSGVKQVIFASSGGTVYGEPEHMPTSEEHAIRPLSPYGIAKSAVEMYLDYYHKQYGLRYVSLRYANVYGPRQNPHGEAGVIAIFSQKLIRKAQPVVNGDGLQTRDYVFVNDVVEANLKALNYPDSVCINIGTGIETNVNQLFDRLNELAGTPFVREHGPAKAGEQKRSSLSFEKAKEVLDWEPKVSLHTGLQETYEWFHQRYMP